MTKKGLKPKEELFCQYYASGNVGSFGNARKSYSLSFNKKIDTDKQKNVVDQLAWRLLSKVKIVSRCNELLDKLINNEVADRELAFAMIQRDNLHAKVSAISEYNKVRGRITTKIKHRFEGVDTETLKERLANAITGGDGNSGRVGGTQE